MKYREWLVSKTKLELSDEEKELSSKTMTLICEIADEAQSYKKQDEYLLNICSEIVNNLKELKNYSNEIIH